LFTHPSLGEGFLFLTVRSSEFNVALLD